jgi:PAS domain S-box-containing protein
LAGRRTLRIANEAPAAGQGTADSVDGVGDHLSTVLAAAQVGEWDVDLVSGDVTLSPFGRQLLGLPAQGRVTLEEIRQRRHPEDQGQFDEVRDAAIGDPARGFIRQSYRIIRPDGALRWLETRGTIFRDRHGRAVRMLGVMLDVTDRQERERALEQGWRRFEAALANTAIVLFEQDRELRYTWIHNPPLTYEAHNILGNTDLEMMGADLAGPITTKKLSVLETGLAMQTEVTVPLPSGTGSFDLHIEPLRDDQGEIVGISCAGIELSRTTRGQRRDVEDRHLLLDRMRLDRRQRDRGLIPICTSALERKLCRFALLDAEERRLLATLEAHNRYVANKERLNLEAEAENGATWLIGNGWVYSYALLADGRRQIIGFHLPGDLIGRDAQLTTGGRHLYATASDCVLCTLDPTVLAEILQGRNNLAAALRGAAAQDAAIIEQHLVSIGRRSAEGRLAHLLLELGARLEAVQLADAGGYRCPLTQELLADALGLTNVHVNRLLRRLRDEGLLTFMRGFVAFKNKPRLIELAEYDPAYLGRPPG